MRLNRDIAIPLCAACAAGVLAMALLGRLTQTAPVIVAAQDIGAFEVIEGRMLKVVDLPVLSVHPKAYRRVKDVAGRRAAGPVQSGQQVLSGQTVEVGNGYGKTGFEDCVVMFVPMPASRCVGGLVRGGDVVDLICSANDQRGGTAAARTILRNVPVLAGLKPSGRSWEATGSAESGLNLLLTSKDAETVALCLETGSLYACLSASGGR